MRMYFICCISCCICKPQFMDQMKQRNWTPKQTNQVSRWNPECNLQEAASRSPKELPWHRSKFGVYTFTCPYPLIKKGLPSTFRRWHWKLLLGRKQVGWTLACPVRDEKKDLWRNCLLKASLKIKPKKISEIFRKNKHTISGGLVARVWV